MKVKKQVRTTSRKVKHQLGGKLITLDKTQYREEPVEKDFMREKTGKGLPHSNSLSKTAQLSIVRDAEAGMTEFELADKYKTSRRLVERALKEVYVKDTVQTEVLKKSMLRTATAASRKVYEGIPDMNPMQAAVATGIMVSRYVELDKHTQNKPQNIDFQALTEVQKDVRDLARIAEQATGVNEADSESVLGDL